MRCRCRPCRSVGEPISGLGGAISGGAISRRAGDTLRERKQILGEDKVVPRKAALQLPCFISGILALARLRFRIGLDGGIVHMVEGGLNFAGKEEACMGWMHGCVLRLSSLL